MTANTPMMMASSSTTTAVRTRVRNGLRKPLLIALMCHARRSFRTPAIAVGSDRCAISGLLWRRACDGSTDTPDRIEKQPRGAPERIDEDRRDTHGHRHHRPYRVNQAGGCEGDAAAIEKEGQDDVLDHLAIAPAADLAGFWNRAQPVRQDDDIRRFDRDVCAAA